MKNKTRKVNKKFGKKKKTQKRKLKKTKKKQFLYNPDDPKNHLMCTLIKIQMIQFL